MADVARIKSIMIKRKCSVSIHKLYSKSWYKYENSWNYFQKPYTRPIGLPPHAPVAQKIADQRWLIANSAKIGTFLYKMMWLKVG